MNKMNWKKRLVLLFVMGLLAPTASIYAGDDGDDDAGTGFIADTYLTFFILPWADWHKGTFLERQNGGGTPPEGPIKRPTIISEEKKLRRAQKNNHDHREIEYLDPGECHDCFKIRKHAVANAGIIVVANVTEPHSYVSGRVMGKFMASSKKQSIQAGSNQLEARDTGDIYFKDVLKEIKDYEDKGENNYRERWAVGDVKRKTGIHTWKLFGGIGYFGADASVGAFAQGQWSKKIQKISKHRYYVSFTREGGAGPLARLQLFMPLSKAEAARLYNGEYTISFLFDIRTQEGRRGLKAAITNRFLADVRIKKMKQRSNLATSEPGDSEDLVDIDEEPGNRNDIEGISVVASRLNTRQKGSLHAQAGIPFLARVRASDQEENLHKRIIVERTGKIKDVKVKVYIKQNAWRHLNLPYTIGHDKKWKRFPSTHSHYNKVYEGIAREVTSENGIKTSRPMKRELRMQVAYSNDNIKYKKFAKKKEEIAKKAGLNTINPELPYSAKSKIGSAAAYYRLQLNEEEIQELVDKVAQSPHLFGSTANQLINQYFGNGVNDYDDPFNLARGRFTNKNVSITWLRWKTQYQLHKITHWLNELGRERVATSKSKTSTLLAKISKAMGENQFVLQAVLSHVATPQKQLGVFTLSGEEFRKKTYVVDPVNMGREGEEIPDQLEDMNNAKEENVGPDTVENSSDKYFSF